MRDVHLHALFFPQTVAVVGDCDAADSPAARIVSNLKNWGYQGKIIPVNWHPDKLPQTQLGSIDLAVICLVPTSVPTALQWAASQSIKSVIVTSSGFREIGESGHHLEEQIVQIAASHNLTLLGPNCLGVASWSERMNASLVPHLPGQGRIAFFSPSGSICSAVLNWAATEGIGLSRFASLGNRAIIDEASMLQFLAGDPETTVILGYLEGMNNGRRFARISQTITRKKPVIMLHGGLTAQGQKAMTSHPGPLAGSELAYQTALRQAGIIQAKNLSDLFDLARAFGTQPLPRGPNLVILTDSGGAGLLAADSMPAGKMHLTHLGNATLECLKTRLPRQAHLANPVDISRAATPIQYAQTLQTVLDDPQVHMALVVVTPGPDVDLPQIVRELAQISQIHKPVTVCLIGQEGVSEEKRYLQHHGLPCYAHPQAAMSSLQNLLTYAEWKEKPYPVEVCYRRDKAKAEHLIFDALKNKGKTELMGIDLHPLFQAYELPFPQTELARTSKSAVKIARRFNCPVVLKIASPDIRYKRDIQGVEIDLRTSEEVHDAFLHMTARAQNLRSEAFISGCIVQEMILGKAAELCIHMQQDPKFGPLLRFGLSGSHAEIFNDFSLRLAPLSLTDATGMIREIKAFPLLKQNYDQAPLDLRALEDILLTISQMALDFPEIHTLEVDPLLITSRGAWIAGARIALLAQPD